jgi:hypothetical protein
MDWGDAPAWAALFVSVIAAAASIKAASSARDSVAETKRSADAAEVSARVAEETLADQRREAAERRAAEEEANRPRAELRIRHLKGAKWILVNEGTGPANNIVCVDGKPYITRDWPEGASIPAKDAHEFTMAGASGAPIPSVLRMKWDGQEEPMPVLVPPRIG